MKKAAISKRAENIPASGIRKLMPLADAARKKGTHIYHINIGQPDIETPDEVMAIMHHNSMKVLEYAPSPGLPSLVDAWARFYQEKNIPITSADVIVTSGGAEGLLFAFLAMADPGDELLVFEPFYTSYAMFAAMGNIHLHPVTTHGKNGFHLPDRKTIEKAITQKTKAILVCNPNNPTGTMYTDEEVKMLADIATAHGLFLLSDETYQEIIYDGKKVLPFASIEALKDSLVIVDSVSKRFNACGARIGCVVSRNQDIMRAVLRFAQARLAVASIDQLAMVPMLNNSTQYITELTKKYQKRRDTVVAELSKIPGVTFQIPEGAFYMIPKLPIKDSDDFCAFLLRDFSDRGETVMVSPATGFYATPGLGKDEVRLAFVLDEKKMKRAIELLGLALQRYKS